MMLLKTNNEYDVNSFTKGLREIEIENTSLYGNNEIRSELKIVDVDGFLFRGIDKIAVESGDMVIFRFYNSFGEIVVEYIMKVYERLIVKSTSVGALRYSFVGE